MFWTYSRSKIRNDRPREASRAPVRSGRKGAAAGDRHGIPLWLSETWRSVHGGSVRRISGRTDRIRVEIRLDAAVSRRFGRSNARSVFGVPDAFMHRVCGAGGGQLASCPSDRPADGWERGSCNVPRAMPPTPSRPRPSFSSCNPSTPGPWCSTCAASASPSPSPRRRATSRAAGSSTGSHVVAGVRPPPSSARAVSARSRAFGAGGIGEACVAVVFRVALLRCVAALAGARMRPGMGGRGPGDGRKSGGQPG